MTPSEFRVQLAARLKRDLESEYVDTRLATFTIEQQDDDTLFIEEPESYVRGAWPAGPQLVDFVAGMIKSTAPPGAVRDELKGNPDWDDLRRRARERTESVSGSNDRRRSFLSGLS